MNEEGTSYTFSYKGNSASDSNEAELSVYTQENEGDPLQKAMGALSEFFFGSFIRSILRCIHQE